MMTGPKPQTLAELLIAARAHRGFSRQALQTKTGISAKSIEKYEAGQVPGAAPLALLCAHLDLDPLVALRLALGDSPHTQEFAAYESRINTGLMMQVFTQMRMVMEIAADVAPLMEAEMAKQQDVTAALSTVFTKALEKRLPPELLSQMKNGPSQQDQGRSTSHHQPQQPIPAPTGKGRTRSRKGRPKK